MFFVGAGAAEDSKATWQANALCVDTRGRLSVGRVRSGEVLAAETRPSCASSGAQIGQRWEGGAGVRVGRAACLQRTVEQEEPREEIPSALLAIYCYRTCLIRESPVPFCSQTQIPNPSCNYRILLSGDKC